MGMGVTCERHNARFMALFGVCLLFVIGLVGCGGGGLTKQNPASAGSEHNQATDSDTSKNLLNPLPAPSNFRLECCGHTITLFWDQIADSNNIGYQIFKCSELECSQVLERINGSDITSFASNNLPYGVMQCYAIGGISSNAAQQVTQSEILCGIPEENLSYIGLIAPGNNVSVTTATPTFSFAHRDDYYQVDYFELIVKDKDGVIVMNKRIVAYTSNGGVGEYAVVFSSDEQLINGEKYSWSVYGHATNASDGYSSQNWVFQIDSP